MNEENLEARSRVADYSRATVSGEELIAALGKLELVQE